MPKTFIIKNKYGKVLGRIIYSGRKFKIDVSLGGVKERLEELLNEYSREGIRNLGEVILDEPIKLGGLLFLNEVRNQLAREGYILVEKKRKK